MTDEKVNHVCVVCGSKLPNMSGYDLVQRGAGMFLGDGSILYFCIGKHTQENIARAAANPPGFHRASEGVR